MALNSINTNIAAMQAQGNIGKASTMAGSSIARLSSGNRIVRASDDVAAMSAGTSLRTNVTTLKVALINTSQGSSLLQVADGALNQVTDILQRQKSIAVQAGSGSLTSSERSFLNQEFQNLTEEIDRLVSQTNFNGVTLLNGELSERVDAKSVAKTADRATIELAFADNIDDTETVIINGVTLTGVTAAPANPGEFRIGTTTQETVQNLADYLNNINDQSISAANKLALSEATYKASGSVLTITHRAGGSAAENFTVNLAGTALDTAAEGNVGGKSGGSSILVFTTGFASATDPISAVAAAAATTPFQDADVLQATVDGVTYDLYTVGTSDSLEDIVNGINASADTTGVSAKLELINNAGTLEYNMRLEISNSDGTTGDITFVPGANYAAGTFPIEVAANTTHVALYSLNGGGDTGVGMGTNSVGGVIGNNIMTGQVETNAKVVISFPDVADADLLGATAFGGANTTSINVGGQDFFFTQNGAADKAPNEITIGASLEETLDNAAATINAFAGLGSVEFELSQVKVYRSGQDLVVESKTARDVNDITGAVSTVALANFTGVSVSNGGNLNNSNTGGVDINGVTNKDFIGKISGFKATYDSANRVDISIKVGDYTYTASSVTTNSASDTTVRLYSDTLADGTSGGYFDINLAAGNGNAVSTQVGANTFANRLDAAVGSLNFYQNRNVSSYNGSQAIITDGAVTGSLIGTRIDIQLNDFSDVKIDSVRVNAPEGVSENGSIEIKVNGTTYKTAVDVGSKLGANQTYTFTNTTDPKSVIEFTTGDTAIEFNTAAKAKSLQQGLQKALGVGDGSASLKFQVGVTTTDTLSVSLNNISTETIFKGAKLDVLTAESAAAASDALDLAIDAVTAVRAEVGALQSRFDFAAANVESSISNQDAARGVLLDTDIAAESTSFSQAQVKLQAGISVLAQANLLPQNLLKLIG